MRFLDDVFEMHGGEPLDFSIRTLEAFFLDEFGVNLYTEKYAERGTSKANRLRTFLANEPNATVAKALQSLWDYREFVGAKDSNPEATRKRYAKLMQKLGSQLDSSDFPVATQTSVQRGPSHEQLAEIISSFRHLYSLEPHPRGFAFEKFLLDLFEAYALDPRGSFRKTATQIDGSFTLDSELYLLEAKWQNSQSDAAELFTFEGKVSRGASWTRGLFVSHAGFSDGALAELSTGRSIVCIDGLDMHDSFERRLPFDDVVRAKVRRAAETGLPFTPVRVLFP